ncbi:MAG: hypothetical protein DRI65_00170 [Chloroflexota bacterium]|nr:MAG: hypothetical protein DRI65_00170 [Chloroflexota bacterium]
MVEKRYLAILCLVIMLLVSVPYVVGFQASNAQQQFGGFLINPMDGHSYLAKMQQGFNGEWKFKLPYTAEPGEGAYLFLFYLGLGHLGRIVNIPLIYVFHAARLVSAAWLILVVYQMMRAIFEDKKAVGTGLVLALTGSGLGWIGVLTGAFTSDFWVAEAYPFLSMYTNPHFVLGLGMMINAFLPKQQNRIFNNLISGLLLGIIQPFAIVIVGLVKIISCGLKIYREKLDLKGMLKSTWIWATVSFNLSGGMVILYQLGAILGDPVLSLWHQQNITLKPTPLDLVISLSPCLLLGVVGAGKAWKSETGKTLVLWGAICLVLVFIPWSLQRRFLTGIFFPLAALSIFGLYVLAEKTSLDFKYWGLAVLILAIPTNMIVITSGLQAISEKNSKIFIERDLVEGLEWINANAGKHDLVLAEQRAGLFLPSVTGRRVVYGHPFETIQAEGELKLLEQIFQEPQADSYYEEVLESRGVDYVLCGAGQEKKFSDWLQAQWKLVFRSNEISLYARQPR